MSPSLHRGLDLVETAAGASTRVVGGVFGGLERVDQVIDVDAS